MTGLTFEGEADSLTPRQQEFIGEVIQKRGLKANKVIVETLGKAGDNFAANVKKIIAKLENGEKLNMVAKIAPTNEMLRFTMSTVIVFGNECLIYDKVLPKFRDLQLAAGLSPDDTFRFPKCYGALLEPLNEIILLEDLTELNFKMLDRFTPLTNEYIKVILKKFAVLHSLSYALKKQDHDLFDSFKDEFGDVYAGMLNKEEFKTYFKNLETDTIALMDSDKYKKAISGTVSQVMEISSKIFRNEMNSRYSVITHGDAWTNNVMFRIEENVPEQAIMIDYQLSKVVSPVNDLQYMIFNCTDYTTRHKHYYEWIDYYHSELDNFLANFGLKANDVYPRDQLDADMQRYTKVNLATIIMAQSMLIRNTEDAAKMKEAMENLDSAELAKVSATLQVSALDTESVALFKNKITGLVNSYQDFGYLDL